ncbi:MAG: hypothetical protein ACR2O3_02540 [Rhizobiaceae bacterium]
MSVFTAEWLDAREPIDHVARSEHVLSAVAHYFMNDPRLRITDIGCGTGSTIRALKPFLSNELDWHLVDNDDALLERAKKSLMGDRLVFSLSDMSKSTDVLFSTEPSLITTSAFLDLVSLKWLESFCHEVTSREIPFYAALTYDGRAGCEPEMFKDAQVVAAVNKHQRSDKGFGSALGPDAAAEAIRLFEESGYIVTQSNSDWRGDARHREFQRLLLEGWCAAACEMEPQESDIFSNWLVDRLQMIEEGTSSVYVGHVDFFAVPRTQAYL